MAGQKPLQESGYHMWNTSVLMREYSDYLWLICGFLQTSALKYCWLSVCSEINIDTFYTLRTNCGISFFFASTDYRPTMPVSLNMRMSMPSWWVSQMSQWYFNKALWFCHTQTHWFWHLCICFLFYRFDIYGLSPDADEDESGIKRASENSMFAQAFGIFALILEISRFFFSFLLHKDFNLFCLSFLHSQSLDRTGSEEWNTFTQNYLGWIFAGKCDIYADDTLHNNLLWFTASVSPLY